MEYKDIISGLIEVVKKAQEEVLRIYDAADMSVEYKADESPLTEADKSSNFIITEGLKSLLQEVPVISEENAEVPYGQRKMWRRFWLVDPLDGTKEFIKRNGEFTINVALIEDGAPLFGVVAVPAKGMIYYGGKSIGVFSVGAEGNDKPSKLERAGRKNMKITAACSRSHLSEKTKIIVSKLDANMVSAGSALKFVLVAEGKADFYPRFGTTWEWDTAAGHAIAEAAGKSVTGLDGKTLLYNKETLKHEGFLVCAPEIKDKLLAEIARL